MPKRRPGALSQDDLELWQRVARSAKPLQTRPVARPLKETEGACGAPKNGAGTAPQTPAIPAFKPGSAAPGAARPHELASAPEHILTHMPLRMDKKAFTRLKRGKLRPERKLDLHGMTLAQAHPELIRFILSAHAAGCRLVLIVTGKGRSGRDEGGPIPTPRGILRHQVPGWLHAPPLRSCVLQVTDAHVRHGGGGAYYVYLTRG